MPEITAGYIIRDGGKYHILGHPRNENHSLCGRDLMINGSMYGQGWVTIPEDEKCKKCILLASGKY